MARDWLNKLGVVPPNSPALAAGARVYDLALALQDGVVLCNTLNKLIPGAIEQVHSKPEKQFLKMQNINSFLGACPKFGLKSDDLFTADELYYASNFQKVITCLSALSRTNSAKMSAEGFPRDNAVKNTATDGGEDMYQSLEDLVGQSISFQESAAANASAAFDPDDDDDDDEIYGSIRNVIENNADVGGEDVYSDLMYQGNDDIYAGVTAPEDKRNCVLNELFETERNYVDVLRVIIDKFMKSLEQSKLSKNDLRTIFSNVGDLLDVHVEFFGLLEKSLASKTGRNISKPFQLCTDKMKAYGQFCCEIPVAITKLKELALKPAFAKILDQSKKESGQRFPLKDLLNVPMQRVLKYPLLIKELIKATPDTHPDKKRLLETAQLVKSLAEHINKTKKDHDALINVINSVKKYKGPPLKDIAPLIKDGDVKVKEAKGKEKLKEAYVFLFQTAVLFCKTKGTAFDFKELLELKEDMEVVDVPFWNLSRDEQQGKYTFAWCLKTGSKDMWFAAKSLATKKKWMNAMQGCLDEMKDAKGARPEVAQRNDGVGSALQKRPSQPTPKKTSKKSPSSSAQPRSTSYEQWVIPGKGGGGGAAPPPDDGADVSKSNFASAGDEGWFSGNIQRPKAEKILEGSPDGTFLVRESHTRPGDYSLSVQFDNNVKHIKINRTGNKYDLAPDARSFPSIQELVEHFQTHSLNRHFPGMETTLAIPFKANLGKGGNRGSMFGQEKAVGIGRARARFAYQAKSHDELSFERGTEIVVLSTEDQDPGWWRGQLPDGKVGMFPANYVQQL